MGKTMTNEMIVKLFAKGNLSLAQKMGYDADSDTVDASMLKRFGAIPSEANEFLSTINNVLINQIAFDTMKGWNAKYTWAQYDASKYGDIEQYLTAILPAVEDYSDSASPFANKKPSLQEQFVKTELRKVIPCTMSEDIFAGAFGTEGGLASLVGIIMKNLKDSLDVFMYEYLTAFIETNVTKKLTVALPLTAGEATVGDTENAQKAYEQIVGLVNKMAIPSTDYNTGNGTPAVPVKTLTPSGTARLILNPSVSASLDVNVVASLFNSSEISKAKYFSGIDIVKFTNQHILGVVLDPEALRWGFRLYKMASIYNPATLYFHYFLHFWAKVAVVKTKQAVLLVDSSYTA